MGQMESFPSNGATCDGYLAEGGGPGVIVVQEWWGLVPHITDVVDRFGDAGFTALAPDLYRGEVASEPDGAGKLMMALNLDQAARDLSGAIDVVRERSGVGNVGAVGYCMGAGLALMLATQRPDAVKAVAPYYGRVSWKSVQPDWSALDAKIVGEYAELDESFPPDAANEFAEHLRSLGKDVTIHVHDGCRHGFFNDARPEVYNPEHALQAWDRTLELFRGLGLDEQS